MITNPLTLHEDRPSRADAIKNRARLLETARRLFDEQGVEGVSMSAIAEAASVGKGTLYRHFENKTQLCVALLDDEQRRLQERTLERLRTHPHTARENLRWFLRAVVEFVWSNIGLLTVGEVDGSIAIAAHLWWHQTVRGLLIQLKVGGDIEVWTDILYTLINPQSIAFQQRARGHEQQRVINGLMDLADRLIDKNLGD